MMGASAPAAPALMAPAPAGMAPTGRDDAFWSQMSADTSGFMASQDKLGADMQAADDQAAAEQKSAEMAMRVTTTPIEGTNYVIPFAGNKAMGTLPLHRPEAPMTPEDFYAARAMGGDVQMQMGAAKVSFPGQDQGGGGKGPKVTYTYDDKKNVTGGHYTERDKAGKLVIKSVPLDGAAAKQEGGWMDWANQ